MALKKIDSLEAGSVKAIIGYDVDFDEYCVQFSQYGKRLADADYFTNDKHDAMATATAEFVRLHNLEIEANDLVADLAYYNSLQEA